MAKPRITALDIEQKEFTSSFKGYNASEVRAFLEKVAAEIEVLERENRMLREKLASIESERDRLKEVENRVKDTLLVAQSAADNARQDARKEAELILREAEVERVKIVSEIERLRAERDAFVVQLKSYLDAFYERLSSPTQAAVVIENREEING
jgi:cell division initiation protein